MTKQAGIDALTAAIVEAHKQGIDVEVFSGNIRGAIMDSKICNNVDGKVLSSDILEEAVKASRKLIEIYG
jgi:hypothetical protein